MFFPGGRGPTFDTSTDTLPLRIRLLETDREGETVRTKCRKNEVQSHKSFSFNLRCTMWRNPHLLLSLCPQPEVRRVKGECTFHEVSYVRNSVGLKVRPRICTEQGLQKETKVLKVKNLSFTSLQQSFDNIYFMSRRCTI